MLIVDSTTLRIEWLATERVVKKTASGFVPSDLLRPSYEKLLAFLASNGATSILSDNRQMWPTAQEDLEWIERDWLPRMLAAGWRSWAVIEPVTSLGAMNVRRWVAIYRAHGVAVHTVASEEAALAWLRERRDGAQAGEAVRPAG